MGNKPSHEQLDNDYYTPFNGNVIKGLLNHIDGYPSAHYEVRNLFVEIVCGFLKTPYDLKNFTFAQLPEFLIDELRLCVEKYGVEFDWSWTKQDLMKNQFHEYVDRPYNDESARKWEIEKKYIFFWLDKAKSGEIDSNSEKCVIPMSSSDKTFNTDGERIAKLYYKNILKSEKCEYLLYRPHKTETKDISYELIGKYSNLLDAQTKSKEMFDKTCPNAEEILLHMEKTAPNNSNDEWGPNIRDALNKANGFSLLGQIPLKRLKKSDPGFYPSIIVKQKL